MFRGSTVTLFRFSAFSAPRASRCWFVLFLRKCPLEANSNDTSSQFLRLQLRNVINKQIGWNLNECFVIIELKVSAFGR
ncbi:hypothetical protein K469DRAFT_707168 [Zopfia rhizophila CBS 207.26]|uniref:Uncharacterized protein n=1 Tax=Zopfia rhizophila CBS 207.26 TaxID=1314779 RepID=A0A6A6E813_9PEZI|nr:hypothetical protein K469DRAFT_707168 [Zopfia rhizophila CBS 207.26]